MAETQQASGRKLTISGVVFDLADVYQAGHVCEANEAKSLNQTRAENIRNNFADKVKKAVEEAGGDDKVNKSALQKELDKYADEYVFHAGGGGRVVDPVEKEAKAIATELLHGQLKKAGLAIATYKKEKADKYAENLDKLMQSEGVMAEAEAIVKRRNKLADTVEL